jgi:hypothetical protein
LADLHLDRDTELAAFRVKRIILAVVGFELEPVRIGVRADEAQIAHGALERPHALHAFSRIDAGKPAKPVGMGAHRLGDPLVGHVPGVAGALLADLAGDKERALDAGRVHLCDHLLVGYAGDIGLRAANLLGVEGPRPGRAGRHDLRRQRIDHDVDRTRHAMGSQSRLLAY